MPTIKHIKIYTNLDGFDSAGETAKSIRIIYEYCEDNDITIEVYYNDRLHGKAYLFYKGNIPKGFIITSGNFTDKGLKFNQEYGISDTDAKRQQEFYGIIRKMEYLTLSKADTIRIETEYKQSIPDKKPHKAFKGKNVIKSKKQGKVRYFLKALGKSENGGYPLTRNLSQDNPIGLSERQYNTYKNNLPEKGDVFICRGTNVACIVGYCELENDIPIIEEKYPGDEFIYNYYYHDLCPEFSHKWIKYIETMKVHGLVKEFNAVKPDNVHITPKGSDKLNYRSGIEEITKEFAEYLIGKMESKCNK